MPRTLWELKKIFLWLKHYQILYRVLKSQHGSWKTLNHQNLYFFK